MKPYVALFGVLAGAFVAVGQMTATQWHAIGVALLALTLRYGLTVLPWLLSAVLAWLWLRERKLIDLWRSAYSDQTTYYAARMAERQPAPRMPQPRRKARR